MKTLKSIWSCEVHCPGKVEFQKFLFLEKLRGEKV